MASLPQLELPEESLVIQQMARWRLAVEIRVTRHRATLAHLPRPLLRARALQFLPTPPFMPQTCQSLPLAVLVWIMSGVMPVSHPRAVLVPRVIRTLSPLNQHLPLLRTQLRWLPVLKFLLPGIHPPRRESQLQLQLFLLSLLHWHLKPGLFLQRKHLQ
jgi:hypothetical protein